MTKRSRLVSKEDSSVKASGKYNGKYFLGNLHVCGDCGVPYRRRTERGKVAWSSATRIEKDIEKDKVMPPLPYSG